MAKKKHSHPQFNSAVVAIALIAGIAGGTSARMTAGMLSWTWLGGNDVTTVTTDPITGTAPVDQGYTLSAAPAVGTWADEPKAPTDYQYMTTPVMNTGVQYSEPSGGAYPAAPATPVVEPQVVEPNCSWWDFVCLFSAPTVNTPVETIDVPTQQPCSVTLVGDTAPLSQGAQTVLQDQMLFFTVQNCGEIKVGDRVLSSSVKSEGIKVQKLADGTGFSVTKNGPGPGGNVFVSVDGFGTLGFSRQDPVEAQPVQTQTGPGATPVDNKGMGVTDDDSDLPVDMSMHSAPSDGAEQNPLDAQKIVNTGKSNSPSTAPVKTNWEGNQEETKMYYVDVTKMEPDQVCQTNSAKFFPWLKCDTFNPDNLPKGLVPTNQGNSLTPPGQQTPLLDPEDNPANWDQFIWMHPDEGNNKSAPGTDVHFTGHNATDNECHDGRDNNTDGVVDTEDPGCLDPNQISEGTIGRGVHQCNDTRDNDGNGESDAGDTKCGQGNHKIEMPGGVSL